MSLESGRKSVVLALLAVLVGAIVQITQSEGPFTSWQTMVGLIMIFVSMAYREEINKDSFEGFSYALVIGAGVVFVLGFPIDLILMEAKWTVWDNASCCHEQNYGHSARSDILWHLVSCCGDRLPGT